MQQAQDKEEILLPWLGQTKRLPNIFPLKDFENFLKRNKFFEYKSYKIAQRLRDMGGESTLLKVKGKPIRVWIIPAFDSPEVEITQKLLTKRRLRFDYSKLDSIKLLWNSA